MSFACRPIGLAKGMRWEFVGAGPRVDGAASTVTANFPSAAQAGDLAVFCAAVSLSGTLPAGWTQIASASSMQAYKVCAGGETSVAYTSGSGTSSRACILLFRPVGGSTALHDGQTDSPAANRSMSAGAVPSLIVAIGNTTRTATWSPTLPGSWDAVQNVTTGPALYVAWRLMDAGESTGTMNLGGSGTRQTFGIWGIT